jgi:GNAT superfamily N-acetyltransferase
MLEIAVRRPSSSEHTLVRGVVQTVVDETYGGVWAAPPLQIDEEDWSLAWLADIGGGVAGMALTLEEWVSDLWVLKPFRGRGIGTALLTRAEAEIAGRGHPVARLRVVGLNTQAQAFYAGHGWQIERRFPHEHLPVAMVEMAKEVRPSV